MNNTDGMTQDAILGELNAIYDLAVKAGCPLDQHLVDAIAGIIRERDELRERMRAAEALP